MLRKVTSGVLVSYMYLSLAVCPLNVFHFSGTPSLFWTQKLLFLYAVLSVSTICRYVPSVMSSPPTSPDRPSSAVAVMPYSTPVESVFDWFTG